MALDPNLYTLNLVRRENDVSVCDWVESQRAAPKAVYSRARATRSIEYSSILYMTLFGPSHQLVAVTATTAASKNKTLQLYDPDEEVSLVKQGMTFANDWRFRWPGPKDDGLESHTLSWKRDSSLVTSSAGKNAYTCYAIRSPDPNVPLAIYKPLTGRSRQRLRYSTQVWDTQKEESGNIEGHLQMNDYNIRRLEIADLRGLEYLIIMSLSTLLDADYDDKYKTPVDNIYLSFTPAGIALQKSKGRDRASSTIKPDSPNEVAIEEWGQASDYVQYCMQLLRDDGPIPADYTGSMMDHGQNMTFIVLRAEGQRQVPKAIQVAAEVKRAFYKLPQRKKGGEQDELVQYIKDTSQTRAPSRSPSPKKQDENAPGVRPTIKLNEPPQPESPRKPLTRLWPMGGDKKDKETGANKSDYQVPPESVTIFLSKERMPELEASGGHALSKAPRPVSQQVTPSKLPIKPHKPRPTSFAPQRASVKPPPAPAQVAVPPRPLKTSPGKAMPPPPTGAAWNGSSVPAGFVSSGHPAPAGLELNSPPISNPGKSHYHTKPPPPIAPKPLPERSPPAMSQGPNSKEPSRVGRFFERVKQVRDMPPPGSRS